VVFDFSKLDYISSAGLRVILLVCKSVGEDKKVTIYNAKKDVREVFEMTGFDSFVVLS
jgi:anti-sigma B factor antagonist